MKKFINLFSRVLVALVLCAGLMVTGCYDDTALLEQLKNHESRLKDLERLAAQQNINIQSLQTIVNALQDKDYVTNVIPVKDGSTVIGYSITFSKSGSVTIYNGEDGYVPAIGVKQDTDGQWYWTVDGKWMTDSNGNKVRASAVDGEDGKDGEDGEDGADGDKGENGADGVTPKLKIVDGYWYVSYDGGKTWEDEPLGQATGDKGYTMFAEVTYDDYFLYITMADGQKITLPRTSSNQGESGDGSAENVGPIQFEISDMTATVATFTGTVVDLAALPYIEKVEVYYCDASENFSMFAVESIAATEISADNTITIKIPNLVFNTSYDYCIYVKCHGVETYGAHKQFTTVNVVPEVSLAESSVNATSATFSGTVTGLSEVDKSLIEIGMAYCTLSDDFQNNEHKKIASGEISADGAYTMSIVTDPYDAVKYYYCSYILQNGVYTYSEVKEFTTRTSAIMDLDMSSATDLSSSASANCYIVTTTGTYKFKTVKGNSSTSVGDVSSCSILWESLGFSTVPEYGDLIQGVCYKDNYIAFKTNDKYRTGNVVIAAKDANGKILWSWHIWMSGDQPQGEVYKNNAGTMMDRNLGATTKLTGYSDAWGLYYQWGRKDPFLMFPSTITWPSAVLSSTETGTIDFVIANPTTFVKYNTHNYDWYFDWSSSTDNTRWQSSKTIYDPCPAGWRVPDGSTDGVWAKAGFSRNTFDTTNKGMTFSISSPSTTWYPAAGFLDGGNGAHINVGSGGTYWSVTKFGHNANTMNFISSGYVQLDLGSYRAEACSVRCFKITE